jgi:hypothetical protein
MKSLDKLVHSAIQYPLSGQDIMELTRGKTEIHIYEDLMKINSIDELLGKHGACVLLYQQSRRFGHFVSIIKMGKNHIEVFDSLGMGIDKELQFSKFNVRNMSGRIVPHLTHLLEKSGYDYYYNSKMIQSSRHDENTCGRFAALRIRFRHLSLKEFIHLLTTNRSYNADFWVTVLSFETIDVKRLGLDI